MCLRLCYIPNVISIATTYKQLRILHGFCTILGSLYFLHAPRNIFSYRGMGFTALNENAIGREGHTGRGSRTLSGTSIWTKRGAHNMFCYRLSTHACAPPPPYSLYYTYLSGACGSQPFFYCYGGVRTSAARSTTPGYLCA